MSIILYFVPHQDDELLTFGLDIIQSASGSDDCHIYLMTDGTKSAVKEMLKNRKMCLWHFGIHKYTLSDKEFSKARDKEFIKSCNILGIPFENIHISHDRCMDGMLDENFCIQYMKTAISDFEINKGIEKKEIVVKTISPYGGSKQHHDHMALGNAAVKLKRENYISKVIFFQEPYLVENLKKNHPDFLIKSIMADNYEKELIDNVIREVYSKWNPKVGSFAIGFHSMKQTLKKYRKNPVSFEVINSNSEWSIL